MTYLEPTRRRLRAGALVLLAIGLLAFGFGVHASGRATAEDPVPVATGRSVPVPQAAPFGGPVALYGVVPTGDPSPPAPSCSLTTADGADATTALTGAGPASLPGRVVDGRALRPLLVVGETGGTIRCTGLVTALAQPLHLVVHEGQAAMVPMASFSLAALTLVIGGTGVVLLRRADEHV